MKKLYVNETEGYAVKLCRTTQEDIEIETDMFDDKCETYIKNFRLVPEGKVWIRGDGIAFEGMMVSPMINDVLLNNIQSLYEEMKGAQNA